MKETAHYKLNQWELEDRIRMSDFNSDNAKLDAAVAEAMEKAVSEGKRLDASLSTAKGQLQTSINTSKTQLQTSINSVDSRLTASLEAARTSLVEEDRRLDSTKLELVTLLSMTVPASGENYRKIDVSHIDFGSLLLFSVSFQGLGSGTLNFNGSNLSRFSEPGSTSISSGGVGHVGNRNGTFLFVPMKNPEAYIASRQIEGGYCLGYLALAYKDIKTLDIVGGSGSAPLLTIKGVR